MLNRVHVVDILETSGYAVLPLEVLLALSRTYLYVQYAFLFSFRRSRFPLIGVRFEKFAYKFLRLLLFVINLVRELCKRIRLVLVFDPDKDTTPLPAVFGCVGADQALQSAFGPDLVFLPAI